jgi:hypothetical protein
VCGGGKGRRGATRTLSGWPVSHAVTRSAVDAVSSVGGTGSAGSIWTGLEAGTEAGQKREGQLSKAVRAIWQARGVRSV